MELKDDPECPQVVLLRFPRIHSMELKVISSTLSTIMFNVFLESIQWN